MAFDERSGFQLNQLSAIALFNDQGLNLEKTTIETDHSNIKASSFKLRSNELSDFSNFVELVQLESKFDTSFVSLKDVSLFAPQLKGMDDIVVLSGTTEKAVQDRKSTRLNSSHV